MYNTESLVTGFGSSAAVIFSAVTHTHIQQKDSDSDSEVGEWKSVLLEKLNA